MFIFREFYRLLIYFVFKLSVWCLQHCMMARCLQPARPPSTPPVAASLDQRRLWFNSQTISTNEKFIQIQSECITVVVVILRRHRFLVFFLRVHVFDLYFCFSFGSRCSLNYSCCRCCCSAARECFSRYVGKDGAMQTTQLKQQMPKKNKIQRHKSKRRRGNKKEELMQTQRNTSNIQQEREREREEKSIMHTKTKRNTIKRDGKRLCVCVFIRTLRVLYVCVARPKSGKDWHGRQPGEGKVREQMPRQSENRQLNKTDKRK